MNLFACINVKISKHTTVSMDITLKITRNIPFRTVQYYSREVNIHLPRIFRTDCDAKLCLYESVVNEVGDVLECLSIVFTDPEEIRGSYGSCDIAKQKNNQMCTNICIELTQH